MFLEKVTKFQEKIFCCFRVMLQKPQEGEGEVKNTPQSSNRVKPLLKLGLNKSLGHLDMVNCCFECVHNSNVIKFDRYWNFIRNFKAIIILICG